MVGVGDQFIVVHVEPLLGDISTHQGLDRHRPDRNRIVTGRHRRSPKAASDKFAKLEWFRDIINHFALAILVVLTRGFRAVERSRESMRIAQVAPLTEAVPPKLYGGTERVISWLTEELVEQG